MDDRWKPTRFVLQEVLIDSESSLYWAILEELFHNVLLIRWDTIRGLSCSDKQGRTKHKFSDFIFQQQTLNEVTTFASNTHKPGFSKTVESIKMRIEPFKKIK